MDNETLQIDFGSVDDIRAKLPRARDILMRKRAELERQKRDWESWESLVALLEQRAGVPVDAESASAMSEPGIGASGPQVGADTQGEGPLDLVIAVVDRAGGPIRSRDVANTLREQGVDIDNDAVSNALYYASVRATPPRLRKLPKRGLYAPVSWRDISETTDWVRPALIDGGGITSFQRGPGEL